ncbi:MAG: amino acid ABC transporter permease [Candidatus Hermodarchaeota archaeon]
MEQLNELKASLSKIQITRESIKSFLIGIQPTRNNFGWWILVLFLGLCGFGLIYELLANMGFEVYLFADKRANFFDPFLFCINILFDVLSNLNPILAPFGISFDRPFRAVGETAEVRGLIILRGLAQASILTLQMSVISIIIGFVIAVGLAVILVLPKSETFPLNYTIKGLKVFAQIYVDFFRSTPLLVQLYLIYFGLPAVLQDLGIPFIIYEFQAAVVGLSLNTGAYQAEIIRGGILSIPIGQTEAARGLGMTTGQTMRYVILPQALRLIIPPFTNEGINLILNSSLASVVSAFELTRRAKNLSSTYFLPFEVYLIAALFYFIMTFSLAKLTKRFEKKYRIPGLGVHHD